MSQSVPTLDMKVFQSILPISSTDTAFTSLAIDTMGFEYALVFFAAGAIGAADFDAALSLTECATSGGSYTAVSGSGNSTPTQTSDGGMWAWHIDLRKRQRFLKIVADPGNAATLGAGYAVLCRAQGPLTSATQRGWTAEVQI